jgi:fluoroquinolone transport system permease protein
MHTLTVVKTLSASDFKRVRRDAMLKWMVVIPFFMAVFARWVVPMIIGPLSQWVPMELVYAILGSYFFVFAIPALFGAVIGFVLLDAKDDDTLTALQVTPLPLSTFLLYRVTTPTVLSAVFILVCMPIANLTTVPLLELVPLALLAALEAPIWALYAASFAQNKVQGFALTKIMGVIMVAPLVVLVFIESNVQLLAGVLPTYWVLKSYWVLSEGGFYWGYLLVGIAFHLVLLGILLKRFNTVMRKGAA